MAASKNGTEQYKWIALFGLWTLHGAVEFWRLLFLPGGISALSSSTLRLLVGLLLFVWTLSNFFLLAAAYKNVFRWLSWSGVLARSKTRSIVFLSASFGIVFGVFIWILYGLFSAYPPSLYDNYLLSFLPLINLMTFVSFEIVLLVFLTEFLNRRGEYGFLRGFSKTLAIILAVLAGFAGVVAFTGLGLVDSYQGDWSRGLPAVPLLEWQILLACVFLVGTAFLEMKKWTFKVPYPEVLICAVIWVCASALWLSQPVIPNASALKPHPPNFEIYPFLDAQVYDLYAQSVLIGNGFGSNRIPQRPLYIVFLALAHALMGQDYERILLLQTLVFAFFPVLLYVLGREFFGRPIGIAVALLAVLRDFTSNLVSPFTGNLTYSKVYLSEIPAAMLLILFLIVGIRWIRSGFSSRLGFVLGGVLGCAMLIRTQAVVALPVILAFALLMQPGSKRALLKSALLTLSALLLVVAPWLWRNCNLTGDLIFDSPESQTINLALRYGRLNGVEPDVMPLPGESSTAYNQRLNRLALDAIVSDPAHALWGVTNTFLNHGVNNVLLFPLRNELRDLRELWLPSYAFWEWWTGNPNALQSALLLFYLFLFGLGVAAAWHRGGWLGLLPLGLNLAYNLWTSLALLSGQRFMVTMDWSISLYYMIGIFALFGGVLAMLEGGRRHIADWLAGNPLVTSSPIARASLRQYLLLGLMFLGIGSLLPVSEAIFPDGYPPRSQEELVAELLTSPSLNQPGFGAACLQELALNQELAFSQGRALYPRYYAAGDGERITDKFGYKISDEDRLVFEFIGQSRDRIVFPLSQPPAFFPHASDVTLIFGREGELWFVFVKQGNEGAFYVSEDFDGFVCRG
jgi:hypothetical protein